MKPMPTMPTNIEICSTLDQTYREALEDLLFFNPQQPIVRSQIVRAVERYGMPQITSDNGLLRVKVERLPEVQTLYAMNLRPDPAMLIGVMVYVRANEEDVILLHISVHHEYSAMGPRSNGLLVLTLLSTLRSICRRVKGVRNILFSYDSERFTKIPV